MLNQIDVDRGAREQRAAQRRDELRGREHGRSSETLTPARALRVEAATSPPSSGRASGVSVLRGSGSLAMNVLLVCERARLSRDPAVPAVARHRAVVEVRHLHASQVVLRNLVALRGHVDAEDAGGVQAEDLLLLAAREWRIVVLLDERRGHLETAERLDLPLRRAVPDRVGTPQHVVRPERADDLAEPVGAGGGIRPDDLAERRAELPVA